MLESQIRPQFSKFSLVLESAVFWYIWNTADSMARLNSENCGRICDSNTALFLLATRISPASPNFGQAKQGQKFVVPTFHIHFLNPECVTIPWVLAPKWKLKLFLLEINLTEPVNWGEVERSDGRVMLVTALSTVRCPQCPPAGTTAGWAVPPWASRRRCSAPAEQSTVLTMGTWYSHQPVTTMDPQLLIVRFMILRLEIHFSLQL